MWDIMGKALGVPVCDLPGGKCRDQIEVFQWKDGVCELMTKPGLGIDANEDYVHKMAAEGHN